MPFNPLCVECEKEGRTVAAHATDHIVPHKGDRSLFWESTNWQSLCERHHNEKSARERLAGPTICHDTEGV